MAMLTGQQKSPPRKANEGMKNSKQACSKKR
jgi:hypothetical protein